MMNLQDLVIEKARQTPHALAVKDPGVAMTYKELDIVANCFASELLQLQVAPGDRIGIWHDKSAYTVAAMQGILRIGAIYVPLDPLSPVSRIQAIIRDCNIAILVTTSRRATMLDENIDPDFPITYLFVDELMQTSRSHVLSSLVDEEIQLRHRSQDDIAYILYTSGSTGIPKGVCISHRNALAFVAWAVDVLKITPEDRLANHAPLHFDLSVFDLYAAFLGGATVAIIPESLAYMPASLTEFLQREQITIWYSVPSALILMMEQGNLLHQETTSLRSILFAGEPFPLKHLRRLYEHWPTLRYLNLYGPTETNVCSYYEIPAAPANWSGSLPIGKSCSGDTVWAQKEDGTISQPGEEGELMVEGPTVMVGYWGKPSYGQKPYATGDLVHLQDDGNYVYIGRRDHMVKVRGYRIELGDIEAALAEHSAIHEVAVVVIGNNLNARIVAFVVCPNYSPSLLELKRHCAERLPRYMIIDEICVLSSLPRTRNGKIDRLALIPDAEKHSQTGTKSVPVGGNISCLPSTPTGVNSVQ
jgi:amino acid adenylation domain-containing protein